MLLQDHASTATVVLGEPLFREGGGRNLARTIETLTPIIRGWAAYYRLAEVTVRFEELDQWGPAYPILTPREPRRTY